MLQYAGPFLFLASIPAFFSVFGPAAPLASIGLLLGALIGAEFLAPRGPVLEARTEPFSYRLLLHLYIVAQLGVTIWATLTAAHSTVMALVSLSLAVGVTAGVFGMLAAHEMVHSKDRFERVLGAAMLSGMAYRHFRIAHVQGHHRWAGTARDSATARLGESFYAFLPRTIAGQFREAFLFERQRCRTRRFAILTNCVVQDVFVTALMFGLTFLLAGMAGLLFFVAQSVVAVFVLELFNYIAHYGLVRHEIAEGRWERLDDRHSWNSSNVAANLLIFNMGRHSYHHRRPAESYQGLQYVRGAPELPAGYAASILLALIPPLWRRVMDRRAAQFQARTNEGLTPRTLQR